MSGHSKWNNIKRKKEKTDAKKAKIFTRIGRELTMAVKAGGADPSVNSKLRDVVAKAKANNVPNDNIDRIIKKAAGDANSANYEEIIYEGYGPNGIAVVVEAFTDNRNRTAGDVRHYFDKFGGNMGQPGSVMFMFERKGIITIDGDGLSEDKVMEDVLEAGADDFTFDGEVYEVSCEPNDFDAVCDALKEKGYDFINNEVAYIPATKSEADDPETAEKMTKMLDMFDENDDIQAVWTNWEPKEDETEE